MLTWHSKVVSEHLVQLQLAQEVEQGEQELNVGIEGLSVDDHPSVVILNGLRLEDDQYVCFCLDFCSDIDRNSLGGALQRISKL